MSAAQINAEISKDKILSEFSSASTKLADDTEYTLGQVSYAIAGIIFIAVIFILCIVCAFLFMYEHYSLETVAIVGVIALIIVALSLIIAIESSAVSAQRKITRIKDNAINLISSEEALIFLNDVARVYNTSAAL